MDGVVANRFSGADVLFLKITLVGVDTRERELSSAHFASPNVQLSTGESEPFRLDLPMTGKEVRVDLFTEYGSPNTNDLAAVGAGPLLLAQGARAVVRDACSATQHLEEQKPAR